MSIYVLFGCVSGSKFFKYSLMEFRRLTGFVLRANAFDNGLHRTILITVVHIQPRILQNSFYAEIFVIFNNYEQESLQGSILPNTIIGKNLNRMETFRDDCSCKTYAL